MLLERKTILVSTINSLMSVNFSGDRVSLPLPARPQTPEVQLKPTRWFSGPGSGSTLTVIDVVVLWGPPLPEKHGGSKAVFTPSRAPSSRLLTKIVRVGHGGDTAFETYDTAGYDNVDLSIALSGSTLDPTFGDPIGSA